jgi:hypothetical protein
MLHSYGPVRPGLTSLTISQGAFARHPDLARGGMDVMDSSSFEVSTSGSTR